MQEVGRKWQSMGEEERAYFKRKADNDKHRYLEEQRRFYAEVAKVSSKDQGVDDEDLDEIKSDDANY